MTTRRHRTRLSTAVAAAAIAAALIPGIAGSIWSPTPSATAAADCVDGIVPLNPYVVNCNLPPRGNHVIGAAPDAGALIACRHVPACISYYVNYPGKLVVPGYPS